MTLELISVLPLTPILTLAFLLECMQLAMNTMAAMIPGDFFQRVRLVSLTSFKKDNPSFNPALAGFFLS